MNVHHHLTIRAARDDERDAIRALTLASYENYTAGLPAAFWQEFRNTLLATFAYEGPVERIVAEQDGTLIGSVLLYPPGGDVYGGATTPLTWPEVRMLAVVPAARGKGVATALMNTCIRRAQETGARALGLHTSDEFATAQRMYLRMGFVRVPELDFSPGPGQLVKGYRLDFSDLPAGGEPEPAT